MEQEDNVQAEAAASSEQQTSPSAQPTPTSALYRALVGIAAISGIFIVLVYQLTLPVIKKNKAAALEKAVYEVVPGATQVKVFTRGEDGSLEVLKGKDEKAVKYYAGYDGDGRLRGIAVDVVGQGFADKIRMLFGYSPEKEQVIGFKVLESKETPGLGDKIDKDQEFTSQFNSLDVRLDEENAKLLHDIEVVKQGKRQHEWQIAAITGATISSKAVGKILNSGSNTHVPLLYSNRKEIEGAVAEVER
jgi:electron transport complex protein RnfG